MAQVFYTARKTLKNLASGGNMLMVATVFALIAVNLPFTHEFYQWLWTNEVRLQIGSFNLFSHMGHPMTLASFINDALMAVFFFSVGLEIKREVLVGELSSFRKALLPIIGACGGMIVPVVIYYLLAAGTDYAGGMAIPMATDIAFSLGVLSMLGKRVPIGLKIFLTTLAVVDDIGGILVIAIFYTSEINFAMLIAAAVILAVLALCGALLKIQSKMFYIVFGLAVWFLFLNAGIHPTIAGVLVAFCIPAVPVHEPAKFIKTIRENVGHFANEDEVTLKTRTILERQQMDWLKRIESASDKVISPLQDLEDSLHPLVNYFILPLFAFANAGIFFGGMTPADAISGVSLAIICGLVLGKFLGIFSFSWLFIKAKIVPMPEGGNWPRMAAVAMLGGIGFTVSIFIATLSFPEGSKLLNDAKLGILLGSIIAGILGYFMLRLTLPKEAQDNYDDSDDD
ncbi:MAG: Na+/H+ antiporter NhaA [Muribaculaceae bacterium]|nr:Na+/H+ antiporter NhaA [Muribaculaceae bacterium]